MYQKFVRFQSCQLLFWASLIPFQFLEELKNKFIQREESSSSATLNNPFNAVIKNLITQYNTSPPQDELDRARGELNQVKDIMVQNVEQILNRGERIELLVDKTDNMAHQATAFRRGARVIRRQQFWRNQKIMLLSIAVGLVSSTSSSQDCSAF